MHPCVWPCCCWCPALPSESEGSTHLLPSGCHTLHALSFSHSSHWPVTCSSFSPHVSPLCLHCLSSLILLTVTVPPRTRGGCACLLPIAAATRWTAASLVSLVWPALDGHWSARHASASGCVMGPLTPLMVVVALSLASMAGFAWTLQRVLESSAGGSALDVGGVYRAGCHYRLLDATLPVPQLGLREELASYIAASNMSRGAELGVQTGAFSELLLSNWTQVQRWYLVDLWSAITDAHTHTHKHMLPRTHRHHTATTLSQHRRHHIATASATALPSIPMHCSHLHLHSRSQSHAHTLTRSHAHTLTRSHAHTLTRSHAHTLTRSHAHTLTRSHAHTLTRSHAHTLTHSHAHTLTLSHNHTRAHTGRHDSTLARRSTLDTRQCTRHCTPRRHLTHSSTHLTSCCVRVMCDVMWCDVV